MRKLNPLIEKAEGMERELLIKQKKTIRSQLLKIPYKAQIDKKIASRMKNNGATYLVITTIRSDDSEIGYFGFTYCDGKEHKDNKDMMEFVVHVVQKLSKLLDKNIEQ